MPALTIYGFSCSLSSLQQHPIQIYPRKEDKWEGQLRSLQRMMSLSTVS